MDNRGNNVVDVAIIVPQNDVFKFTENILHLAQLSTHLPYIEIL